MKKTLCLLLALALCVCALTACNAGLDSGEKSQANTADYAPQGTEPPVALHGEEDQSLILAQQPTLQPAETLSAGEVQGDYFSLDALQNAGSTENSAPVVEPASTPLFTIPDTEVSNVDTSTYQFSALTDSTLGFTFNYPSHWENVPGIYTVCYREVVEPGDFPARVSITVKRLTHSPSDYDITEQLTSFVHTIYKQYDADTFQTGTPNTQDTFLGKVAFSNTYLAFSGENEVQGFVIGCAIGRTMYVFHFCATYADYHAMESMMRYMLRSVQLIEK